MRRQFYQAWLQGPPTQQPPTSATHIQGQASAKQMPADQREHIEAALRDVAIAFGSARKGSPP